MSNKTITILFLVFGSLIALLFISVLAATIAYDVVLFSYIIRAADALLLAMEAFLKGVQ